MSIDSPLEQQERYIAYGSGAYFVIVIWFIYLQISSQGFLEPFTSVSDGLPDYFTIASLTAISFAIGYFIKYLGVHKFVDRYLPRFHFQKEVEGYIITSLNRFFWENIQPGVGASYRCPKEYEYLDIFYEFINKQSDSWIIQRALYFSYYTKYGLSMNLIALSIFGAIAIVFIILLRGNVGNYGGFALGFFIIIGLSALFISKWKIKREIMDSITRPQIYRIIYDCRKELKEKLECRFRTMNYRTEYDNKRYFTYLDSIKRKIKEIVPARATGLISLVIIIVLIILAFIVFSSMFPLPIMNIQCTTTTPNLCIGTNSDNTMVGTANADTMQGKEGNDRMSGNGGNDNMTGAEGSDEINGADGHDSVEGGNGNDNIDGDNGNDRMSGGLGADNINGGLDDDTIFQNEAVNNEPDGYMDVVNCGPGKDFAFIVESDGDIAANNCETINP